MVVKAGIARSRAGVTRGAAPIGTDDEARLLLPQRVVGALQREQLLVRALLDDLALAEHHDLVGGARRM
jgi:hypothetical protein